MADASSEDSGDVFGAQVCCGGKTFQLAEDWECGLGGTIWEGGRLLAEYVASAYFEDGFWQGKRTVELGAGTGLPGLVAASLGAEVSLTDMEISVPLLQRNIDANQELLGGRCKAEELDWGKTPTSGFSPPLDVVLAADVVYEPAVVPRFVECLSELCGPQTLCLLAFFERVPAAGSEFWKQLPMHFDFEKVSDEHMRGILTKPLPHAGVWKLHRK
mmetsp:Transcript_51029/g.119730  ORF Transcript_51029/g.119730 Transcript_51029/m.119730 type:complete len:216 (+) Transcript_51029:2-649(+)